jgi:AsmA protein
MPAINGQLIIDDGSIQTPYYPAPVKNLQVQALMKGVGTDLASMVIDVKKLSFLFEDHPFDVQLKLANFNDIQYEVAAKGEVNIGNIYKVFAQKGLDVSGHLHTNFALKGKQSDALEGRYHLLQQEGVIGIDSLRTTIDLLPLPILVDKATLRFKQEKMWMDECRIRYGNSDLQAKGYLQQAVEYVLNGGDLKGRLKVTGKRVDVDELMYFGVQDTTNQITNTTSTTTGVVVLPKKVTFQMKAEIEAMRIKGLDLNSVTGQAKLEKGKLSFSKTGFSVAGARVDMDGNYQANGPNKAQFEYHIKADSFDIKRAYTEIKLFREMASSAASVKGMMGLDYRIKGVLDSNMMPILPSLSGGGSVLLSGIQFKNFKLLNSISKKTGRDSLSNPSVKQITIKSTLEKNVFHLERFKIKIFGFRLRCEGESTLDGLLRLKMRLGLPPLGIIGIPMRVTGTHENPQIKLGRGDEAALPETEWED